MSKVMFSLPKQLVVRMKAAIPVGERSQVLAHLLEKEIEVREENLYSRAVELESCEGLRAEMIAWDQELGEDGLENV